MGERKIKEIQEVEREIGRETGVRETERKNDRGEREKITNTKEFMQFYLVLLQSGYRLCLICKKKSLF